MPMNIVAPGKGDKRHRIAVMGGSFDPITDGHLKCACEIVHAKVADEVWIVPCGRRPDKPSLKTPYMHRLIMYAAPRIIPPALAARAAAAEAGAPLELPEHDGAATPARSVPHL